MKKQFKRNIFHILNDEKVENIPLRNIDILKYLINDNKLFDKMYNQFLREFSQQFEIKDLYMKSEDFIYRLNLLVNDCIIPNYNMSKDKIRNMIHYLVNSNIDLYSGVSYNDMDDREILEEFYEMCSERKIGI